MTLVKTRPTDQAALDPANATARAAITALDVALAVVDADGRIAFCDDRTHALGGTPGAASVSDALAAWLRGLAARDVTGPWSASAPDGRVVTVHRVTGNSGSTTLIVTPASPIDAAFRAFLDNAPFGVSMKDVEGRYVACNSFMSDGLHLKPEAIIGQRARDILPAHLAEAIEAQEAEVVRRNATIPDVRHWPERPSCPPRTTLTIKFPIAGPEGSPSAVGTIDIDITEHQRLEQSVRPNEAIMARAQRLAGMGHWTWTARGTDPEWTAGVAEYSDAAAAIFGVAPAALGVDDGAYVERFVHRDDRARVRAAFANWQHRRTNRLPLEYRVVRPDGTVRAVVETIEYLEAPPGVAPTVLGTILDITERKAIEVELRDANSRLIEAQWRAKLAHWEELDADGTLRWSEGADAIFGLAMPRTQAEAIDRIHPDDRARVAAQFDRWVAYGQPPETLPGRVDYELEYRGLRDDGSTLWIHEVGHADYDAAGRVARSAGTIQDITAIKVAEDDILRRDAILGAVSTAAARILSARSWQDALDVTLDSFGEATGASRVSVFTYDGDAKALVARQVAEWCAPGVASQLDNPVLAAHDMESSGLARWAEVLARGEVIHGNARDLPEHERPILESQGVLSVAVVPILVGGRLWGDLGLDFCAEERAVSGPELEALRTAAALFAAAIERETIEAELEATRGRLHEAQKLEAIGQLTGGIAHDFNNLLAVVLGNVELVEEMIESDSPIRRFLETARRATERGAELTHRLLAFSRRQALDPRAVDAKALVASMAGLLRRPLGASIAVSFRLDPETWPATVDPGELENAILNLAVNARDAMPEGGALTIATANVVFDDAERDDGLAPGDYVEIAVADTGTGMAPEVMAQAFEPFFTTKEVGKGTGLGLSMVLGFVKQSGGHVRIESAVGHGTTVRLYLPRALACAEAAAEAPGEAPRARAGETVLVVEDDPTVSELVVAMLRSLDYTVLLAEDGARALAVLGGDARIDLLLTDVVMPGGINGRAVAEQAALLRPGLAILYMSGYTVDAFAREQGVVPEHRLISKPFKKAELARALTDALRGVSR